MKLIGRLFIVFAALALAGWGVWTFAFGRADVQQRLYERAAAERFTAAHPAPASADTFRATVCAASPCLFVEAGGLAFLVGAGEGAADGLQRQGLLRPDIDAVFLTGLDMAEREGLAGLPAPLNRVGRREPLTVFGPEGVAPFVAGANLMLQAAPDPAPAETPPAPATAPAPASVDPIVLGAPAGADGPQGRMMFDSGVVAVRAYPVAGASELIYRFDFNKRSLIVAGCGAKANDIRGAARGATDAALVVAATSSWMQDVDRKAAEAAGVKAAALDMAQCLKPEDALAAIDGAKLSGGLLAPLHPAASDVPARRLWASMVASQDRLQVAAGEPGVSLDLTAGLVIAKQGKPLGSRAPAAVPAAAAASATPEKQAGP